MAFICQFRMLIAVSFCLYRMWAQFCWSFMFSGKEKPFVNRVLADIMPQRNCRAMISDFVSAQRIKLRISRSLGLLPHSSAPPPPPTHPLTRRRLAHTYQGSSRTWCSRSLENSSVLIWNCKRSGLIRCHNDRDFPRKSTTASSVTWRWTRLQTSLETFCHPHFSLHQNRSCRLNKFNQKKGFSNYYLPAVF